MIAIIDTGTANFSSILFALARMNIEACVTKNPEEIKNATHVILPGVGSASAAMQFLNQYELVEVIRNLTQPVLGICLGMQLLFDFSKEGDVACLGIIPGTIENFDPCLDIKIPHMGWNTVSTLSSHPLLENIPDSYHMYFVHSYFASISQYTLATTQHGIKFSAICQRDNFFGVQFHPERSAEFGQTLLKNFTRL